VHQIHPYTLVWTIESTMDTPAIKFAIYQIIID
jgi:hypothetical protein